MKDKILIFLIALAGAAVGANVQPVLTGAGKVLFPENATPATISASSGALTAAAGGTNQNVNVTPSGTGALVVNTNGGALSTPTGQFQIGAPNSATGGLDVNTFANFSAFDFRRANGTNASKSALALDDVIGTVRALGYGATGYSATARAIIQMRAAEAWTDASQGTYIRFYTTPTGTVTLTQQAEIFPSGGFSQSSTDPGAGIINSVNGFDVGGTAIVDSSRNASFATVTATGGSGLVAVRCTVAGTLPIGAVTTIVGNCGASTDTGWRSK